MPFDSNGNFSLVSGYLGVTGQTILTSQHNPPLEDIAAGLSSTLLRTGVSAMLANLPMGGFKITGLADGTAATDAVNKSQLDAVTGDVAGPATSTDNAMPRFDGTTGKVIQNSGVTIDDSNHLTTSGNITSSANFIASSGNVVVAPTGAGNVLLRPNGPSSSTGQMTVASTGAVVINGTLTVTG